MKTAVDYSSLATTTTTINATRSHLASFPPYYCSLRARFLVTSKKHRRKDSKRQRASDRRREKAERHAQLAAAQAGQPTSKAERVAKEGVPDLNEILWLALFPLLAAGAATAFIPEFRETLFGSHEEANTFEMKTRPLSLPGGQKRESTADQDSGGTTGGGASEHQPTGAEASSSS